MTAPILFHVGYHKTATSWMQHHLFKPSNGYVPLAGHAEVDAHITRPHGLTFDPDIFAGLIAPQMAQIPCGGVGVVSSEILSGNAFFGGHESDVFAQRLKTIAPAAKILISIRSQLRILPSVYMQYLLRGGTMPYDRFFQGQSEWGYLAFSPVHFEYDRLIAHYQRLFGPENVYVLTQESLRQGRDTALSNLAAFCGNRLFRGLAANSAATYFQSYPEYAAPVLRRLNHFQTGPMNPRPVLALGAERRLAYRAVGYTLRRAPFPVLLSGRKPVSAYVEQVFADRFRDSNRRLAALATHPLDLQEYP